ncbi:30S ribosomal protein S8e [Candidatus Pacearchaeota archaeon]|nr:30S ribosomal protein S8e [Candidatus Pacearchaeota archaeon]
MNRGKKTSGGKYTRSRKKRKFEIAGQRRIVKLGKNKRKNLRTLGGKLKTVLLMANTVNVEKKKVEIKNVLETPSNRFLARQNIITKGTILQTDSGKVKVTNRPSQEGVINGVLVKQD